MGRRFVRPWISRPLIVLAVALAAGGGVRGEGAGPPASSPGDVFLYSFFREPNGEWIDVSSSFRFPPDSKHGHVFAVPRGQVGALMPRVAPSPDP